MRVTMDDVAARAGVSRAAVSLALQSSPKVSAARRADILRVVAELGYRPDTNARRLASASSGTIGVLLSDLHNLLFAEVLDGLVLGVDASTEQLLLASGFHNTGRERAAVESFLSHRVDGVVLIGSQLPISEIQQLAREVPTVVVGRRVELVDSVSVDDATGATLATEHLIDLGHRRIAHIDGGAGAGAVLRREQFVETMRRNRLASHAIVVGGDYTESGGRQAALKLMHRNQPPTAIFAANDLSALGALSALRSLHLPVPSTVSVIGFDNTMIAQSQYVQLSTIDYPRGEMGERARILLRDRIAQHSRPADLVNLTPSLVVRDTTAPPTAKSSH